MKKKKTSKKRTKQNCDDDDNDYVVRCNQCRNLPRTELITKNETKCLLFTLWLVSFLVFNLILDIESPSFLWRTILRGFVLRRNFVYKQKLSIKRYPNPNVWTKSKPFSDYITIFYRGRGESIKDIKDI